MSDAPLDVPSVGFRDAIRAAMQADMRAEYDRVVAEFERAMADVIATTERMPDEIVDAILQLGAAASAAPPTTGPPRHRLDRKRP
jgi:hypothetical protein